jgi:hypothetical protein
MHKKYDSTVARIAGNIAGPLAQMAIQVEKGTLLKSDVELISKVSVALARAIVAEVERTGPKEELPVADGVVFRCFQCNKRFQFEPVMLKTKSSTLLFCSPSCKITWEALHR